MLPGTVAVNINIGDIFSLARLVITFVTVIYTIRIPYKRRYHWMFLVVSMVMLVYVALGLYAGQSPNATTYLARSLWFQWLNARVQTLLVFQFVLYFVSPRMNLWQKLVLAGGYLFVAASTWVPLSVDSSFITTLGHRTTSGFFGGSEYIGGPGQGDQYLRPFGIDIYVTVTSVLITVLLFRYYRQAKSSILRGQTKYIVLGSLLIIVGFYAVTIARYTGGPSFQNFIAGPGSLVLLLGLRKKGFYAVTPVVETTPAEMPVRYNLEEGHSYLARDSKSAFEAFSELVRSGREGLLITRSFPEDVRREVGIRTTPIRWLAESKGEDVIPPGDLLGLSLTVKSFLDEATKPVVMLHGIEYLTGYDGFAPVLRLIQGLNEVNAAERGILLLPVLPRSLEEKEEALLVSETTPLPAPSN